MYTNTSHGIAKIYTLIKDKGNYTGSVTSQRVVKWLLYMIVYTSDHYTSHSLLSSLL